jgi:DNA polymerase III epsilon subunit family exonuclease
MASMHDLSNYIVFDLETTGLSRYDEIIEVGALKVQGGEVKNTFVTLVRPRCPIQPAASMVNGITDSMVRNAPYIEEVLPDFFGFAGELLVVGHNIKTFDLPFIRRFAGREGASFARNYIDTLALAKERLPHLGSYSLSTLCDFFGIDPQSQHRALGDCYSTNECFRRLI